MIGCSALLCALDAVVMLRGDRNLLSWTLSKLIDRVFALTVCELYNSRRVLALMVVLFCAQASLALHTSITNLRRKEGTFDPICNMKGKFKESFYLGCVGGDLHFSSSFTLWLSLRDSAHTLVTQFVICGMAIFKRPETTSQSQSRSLRMVVHNGAGIFALVVGTFFLPFLLMFSGLI